MASLFGRRKIYTGVDEITRDNVLLEVNKAMRLHGVNVCEEEELYWYRRGVQPILERTKERNSFICNKVVVNFADQAVTFRNGYFLTKPVFYVGRNDANVEKVKELNNYLYNSGKQKADNKVVDWFHTVGVGVIYVKPSDSGNPIKPFKAYALDPRSAFVVYSLKAGNKPKFCVNMVVVDKNKVIFDVYTKDTVYRIDGGFTTDNPAQNPKIAYAMNIIEEQPNVIGMIPMVEYFSNENRMACFETAIPLMNDYNTIESNRADGVEQQIQSLLVATNVDFEEGTSAKTIKENGMVCIKSTGENKADIQLISDSLDQTATQTTLDSLKDQIHALTGMPKTVGSGNASFENVGAAYMDRGYAITDTINRNTEDCYRDSNEQFTKIVLSILKTAVGFEMDSTELDIQFMPPEIDNMLIRTQSAINLKQLGLAPEIILARAGLSNDPVSDIAMSQKYIDQAYATPDATVEVETPIQGDGDNGR